MPLPLIPIGIGIATAASVGLQAYDTLDKKTPITVSIYSKPAQKTESQPNFVPFAIIGAIAVFALMVIK